MAARVTNARSCGHLDARAAHRRDFRVLAPKIDPSTPRMISRPTELPMARAALLPAVARTFVHSDGGWRLVVGPAFAGSASAARSLSFSYADSRSSVFS